MSIEWFDVDGIPVPLIDCLIQLELAGFFYDMATEPSKRGYARTTITLNNMKSHMKIWFDYCEDNNLNWRDVTYNEHIIPLRDYLIKERISNESYNIYYTTWRTFYEWCEKNGIPTLMKFPAIEILDIPLSSKNNDMLAHTGQNRLHRTKDHGHLMVTQKTDYADNFVTRERFKNLVEALQNNDPVYAAIAWAMWGSGLRTGGVVQIPRGPCEQNCRWKRYAELKHEGLKFQKFIYLPKGKKKLETCIITTGIMEKVNEIYIKPFYQERSKIYASKPHYGAGKIPPPELLWLNENGKPIYGYDIETAFREASKKTGYKIIPHDLRHSYATYTVYNYFTAHGIKPNVRFAHDIHNALKKQLGHSQIETTEMYIRTINNVIAEMWLPELSPANKSKVSEHMPEEIMQAAKLIFE